jgi:hypothetical protein
MKAARSRSRNLKYASQVQHPTEPFWIALAIGLIVQGYKGFASVRSALVRRCTRPALLLALVEALAKRER